jgi:acyl-coenzyme A synthetase/AMP-(fatty) acid ligase
MNLFALVHAHHVGATVVGTAAEASHAVLTPALLRRLLDERDMTGLTVVVAGDRLTTAEHDVARASGATVHHYYGAAELSFVAWGRHEEALRLFPGVEAEVRDREIWVRSPYLCSGYDGPEGVLRRDPRGFATVGDLGALDGDRIVVHGRPGTVLTSGATVLTADVEVVLGPHARGRVVVVPAPHADHGEVVAAVLDDAADHAPLVAASRRDLAPAARPRMWLLCRELPLTGGGKVDRAALAEQVATGALRRLT